MIFGIGVDIIEIDRVREAVERNEEFLNKFFTRNEIDFFRSRKMRPQHIAGNFAVKEAVAKSLGTGFRGFSLIDIEVLRNDLGMPVVVLHNNIKSYVENIGCYKLHASISHNKSDAVAYVILEI